MLSIAMNNTERLRLLVDDLLDIRKIEAGKLELALQRVDVMDLVRKSVEQNQGYALRCNISFALCEATEGVYVTVDPLRIGQVLGNLLSNAAKFSPAGAVVEVSVRRNGADSVEIAVRDHGAGIEPRFHGQLFQKFVQVDASDSRRTSGSGLGLAIVKALVEAHHGSVHFESQVGQGSRFSFQLPIAASG